MGENAELMTIGALAAELGVDRWRLAYLIERREVPDASLKVPGRRLFTPEDIGRVREALAARERQGAEGSNDSTA